jgi:hypothetical protein
VTFVDLDQLESAVRTWTGAGPIEGAVVLQLIARLRAAELGERAVRNIRFPAQALEVLGLPDDDETPLDNDRPDPFGGFPRKFAARMSEILDRGGEKLKEAEVSASRILANLETPIVEARPLDLAFAEEPPCSCDEALALRARIAELETQLTYASADFLSLRARIRDLETKLDLYERAEPNGAMERLRRAIGPLSDRYPGSARQALSAADELNRWMVATERRAVDAEERVLEIETRLAAPLPSVGGEWVEGTIRDLERAAQLAIGEEQSKANPDSHHIAVFCNTVRLCRESNRLAKGSLIQPPPMGHAASKEAESDG